MRTAPLFVVALAITAVQGLPQIGQIQFSRVPVSTDTTFDVSGRYYADNSGAYKSENGRYVPDVSGAYHPDASGAYAGAYVHDNSGAYVHDNSGDYVPDYNPYLHQNGRYEGESGNLGSRGGAGSGSGGFGSGSPIISEGLQRGAGKPVTSGLGTGLGITSSISRPATSLGSRPPTSIGSRPPPSVVAKPVSPSLIGSGSGSGSAISPAGGYGAPTPLKQGNAAGFYDNRNYAIIRKVEQVEQDGYHYLYETENGIFGEEEGHVTNKGTDNEIMKAKGFFTYTGQDAIVYSVEYTADENGFVPKGAHLPTPPPIPEAIVRSLEYQKSLGEL